MLWNGRFVALTPVTKTGRDGYHGAPAIARRLTMPRRLALHEDRLFPADPTVRGIARELYRSVRDLPIISPHGHTDAAWFARNEPFGNATELLLAPDHYLFRMLYSQGVALRDLSVVPRGEKPTVEPRDAWKL